MASRIRTKRVSYCISTGAEKPWHRPGSLCLALNCFARRNLNLMKIESRPIPGKPWSYSFYLDLQASLKEANTREALDELREFTESVKILGCYPQSKL
jgi:chorismate mutase / prephenate dehydratase